MIGAGMSGDHAAQGPQNGGDGSLTQGDKGSHHQENHSAERGLGERDGKTHQKRPGGRWKSKA